MFPIKGKYKVQILYYRFQPSVISLENTALGRRCNPDKVLTELWYGFRAGGMSESRGNELVG